MRYAKIGILDSGVGGLTVARAIGDAMPSAHLTYFGDTARMPYGDRPPDQIVRFVREIISFLLDQGVDAIAVACNTSSALALPAMQGDYDVPIRGMIECGAVAAVEASRTGRIGVIATANTVRSRAYGKAITSLRPGAHVVQQACPLLVPMIERGEVSGERIRRILRDYMQPLLAADVDSVVYGCTHYPFLDAELRSMAGPSVALVDPAIRVAYAVKSAVLARDPSLSGDPGAQPPPPRFMTSGDPEVFARLVHLLLGWRPSEVEGITMGAKGLISRNA
jgi:glutamate racemase